MKNRNTVKEHRISTYLDLAEHELFMAMANFNGLSTSELARLMIREYMDRVAAKAVEQGQYDRRKTA